MSGACDCKNISLGNLGTPGCFSAMQIAEKLVFVNYFENDGSVSNIDTSVAIDAAYIADRINEYVLAGTLTPPGVRWYPSPVLENVENIQADTTFQEFNSGRKVKVKKGVRTFTGYIVKGASPELLAKLQKNGCANGGVYLIDSDDNLIGNGSTVGELRPIRYDKDSFDARFVWGTDAEVPMIMFTFDFYRTEFDSDLKMISASDTTISFLEMEGLIDMYATISSITTTGFVAKFFTSYGSAKSAIPITGLVAADFTLAEVSPTPGSVSITSVTENVNAPGTYTFVHAAATAGDVLRLTPDKNGFDGYAVRTTTHVVPA